MWYEKKNPPNPKPPHVACFMRFSGLYLFRIETDWHDYRDAELAITLPVCSDCRGLNYSHVDENTRRLIFTIIMTVKRAEWLASTKWCLFKGHLSPAAVPVGWACVLTIRRCRVQMAVSVRDLRDLFHRYMSLLWAALTSSVAALSHDHRHTAHLFPISVLCLPCRLLLRAAVIVVV